MCGSPQLTALMSWVMNNYLISLVDMHTHPHHQEADRKRVGKLLGTCPSCWQTAPSKRGVCSWTTTGIHEKPTAHKWFVLLSYPRRNMTPATIWGRTQPSTDCAASAVFLLDVVTWVHGPYSHRYLHSCWILSLLHNSQPLNEVLYNFMFNIMRMKQPTNQIQ